MNKLAFGLFGKNTPIVRQSESAECGLACVAMIAAYHGRSITMPELRQRFPITLKGTTLKQIISVSESLDLGARPLRCEPNNLGELQLPAIIHWNLNHFVVLIRSSSFSVTIIDPAKGKLEVAIEEVERSFTGIALELSPTQSFTRQVSKPILRLSDIIPFTANFWTGIGQAILLSFFLQIFVLLAPFFMQLVIDEAILKSDYSFLIALAFGFAVLKLFEVITNTIRSLVFQYLSTTMSFDMESSVLRHLIRLPLEYFQKRSVGDIQQRFNSMEIIRRLVIDSATRSVIDGLLAVTVGIALFLYNPLLASLATLTIALYGAVRLIFMNLSKRLSMNYMVCDAEEQSNFLETIRGIQTIKTVGIESGRETEWRNLAINSLNAQIKVGNTDILFRSVSQGLLGLSNIIIIYLAAVQVIEAKLTIGMVIAFLAYKMQFEEKLMSLLETYISFRILDVQLERVADIVCTAPELLERPAFEPKSMSGNIELRDVGFRYSPIESDIFSGVSLKIKAGESIALVGPSGSGKSTLLKVIIGLHIPSEGKILIDDQEISKFGVQNFRKQTGVVMQDDSLLTGTLEQNISLFDGEIDRSRIIESAKFAAIHDEIESMPMGYQSLVGDMGTTLSGGQAQRVILARALYRRPKLLIMDEGTSQLDVGTERLINASLRELKITRIAAAHRPETIAAADRVFLVKDNQVREVAYEMSPKLANTQEKSNEPNIGR